MVKGCAWVFDKFLHTSILIRKYISASVVHEMIMSLPSMQQIPVFENHELLVDLKTYDFICEPVYFSKKLSATSLMSVRQSVAEKLSNLQKTILSEYQFKIWDAWRPRSVQLNIYRKFWNELKRQHPDWDDDQLRGEVGKFVAIPNDPSRIPPHSTGGAIDLTLVERSTGQELDMGTGFDHFGPEAASGYFDTVKPNTRISANRRFLSDAMKSAGFTTYIDEWWHYDYGNQRWAFHAGERLAFFGEVKETG